MLTEAVIEANDFQVRIKHKNECIRGQGGGGAEKLMSCPSRHMMQAVSRIKGAIVSLSTAVFKQTL